MNIAVDATRVDSESRFEFFSRENFVENETRFSRKYQCESYKSHESCKREKCESCNLRDLQTSKIIIQSEKLVLDPKFSQDSRKTPELKLVMILASLTTKFLFARLGRLATKFVCEIREKRVLLQNFCL